MARLRAEVERRFSDLDLMGHVNNVAYLVYFEESRVRLLAQMAGSGEELPGMVVARQEIDYVRPLGLRREPVVVESWVESVGTSSFVLRYEVLDGPDGPLAARGMSVVVGFDQSTQAKAPLSERFLEVLHQYRDQPA